MQLLPSQQVVHDESIEYIRQGGKRINIIGMAGTGKTVVGAEITKTIHKDKTINPDYNNGCIFVTAPTNKAVAVIQRKIQSPVEFKTIHSALKMSAYTNNKGIRVFIKSKYNPRVKNPFDKCKACIVDESSMLNTAFVGGYIPDGNGGSIYVQGYLEDYPFPIIFMGDNHQINPVGEEDSPIFSKDYKTFELTEIVRQGEGNPIIALSRDIDMLYFKQPNTINGKGYIYSDNKEQFVEDLAEVNGTDEMKYLAYTNAEVDAMNILVRQKRYTNPKKIELGETLVFDKPFEAHYTNEEVKVESVDIITDNVAVPNDKTTFGGDTKPINSTDYIKLKYYRINNSFNIIHEHSEQMFNTIYVTLKENYQRHGWDGRGFHFFEEQFAQIKYNHAITVHKSQGSTYKETIINIGNINFNPKAAEKQRLLYTAITRASDLIILSNVK